MDKKNDEEQKIVNDKGTNPETKISTMNEKKHINFQNNNILINIENLSFINPGKEKIKTVNNNNASNNQNNEDEKKKTKNNVSSGILEEKLETIFLEREKAKLKYNKQVLPETLKYFSSDEESNFSIDNKNKNNEKKTSDNNVNKANDDEKEVCPKKDNKEISEIKSFTRKRFNKNKNKEEKQDKNMYQILLSKKIKNFITDIDDEENNKNENNHDEDEEKKNEIEKQIENNPKENIINDKAEKKKFKSNN
jgi:hypothetical protein